MYLKLLQKMTFLNIFYMHYSKITDATLNNLIRKSSYIDEVTFLDNIPQFLVGLILILQNFVTENVYFVLE